MTKDLASIQISHHYIYPQWQNPWPTYCAASEKKNTIVREKVQTASGNAIHTYIAQTDIDTAIEQNTRGNDISGQVFHDLHSKLGMVKLIKKSDRVHSRAVPTEQRVLSNQSRHGIHDLIQPIPERDDLHNTWVTMPYIGPSLKNIQTAQREFRTSRGNWLELPQFLLWRTLHGVAQGLAWLHCGVPSDYTGGKLTKSWKPIAHNISAASILLDMRRLDEHGYPQPVLYHFHDSVCKPEGTKMLDWRPANEELEMMAAMFHHMAHGRRYRNHQIDARRCDCFTSEAADVIPESFLKCEEFTQSRKFKAARTVRLHD